MSNFCPMWSCINQIMDILLHVQFLNYAYQVKFMYKDLWTVSFCVKHLMTIKTLNCLKLECCVQICSNWSKFNHCSPTKLHPVKHVIVFWGSIQLMFMFITKSVNEWVLYWNHFVNLSYFILPNFMSIRWWMDWFQRALIWSPGWN